MQENIKVDFNVDVASADKLESLYNEAVSKIKPGDNVMLVGLGHFDFMAKLVEKYKCKLTVIDKSLKEPLLKAFFDGIRFIAADGFHSVLDAVSSVGDAFDKILMILPSKSNIHLKIIEASLKKLRDDDSMCVAVSSARWIEDARGRIMKGSDFDRYKNKVASHIESIRIMKNGEYCSIFFTWPSSDIGVHVLRKNKTFAISNPFELMKFESPDETYRLFSKISSKKNRTWSDVFKGGVPAKTSIIISHIWWMYDCQSTKGDYFRKKPFETVTYVDNKRLDNGKTFYEHLLDVPGWKNRAKEHAGHIEFENLKEARNFYDIAKTPFFRFVLMTNVASKNLRCDIVPWLGNAVNPRTGCIGYASMWTNDDICNYFGLTDEEKSFICKITEEKCTE